MLQCPKQLHPIHTFQADGRQYVADLFCCQVLEIDALTHEILKRCSSSTNEEIVSTLSHKYRVEEVEAGFLYLAQLERTGLLFPTDQALPTSVPNHRRRYLCPNPGTFVSDIHKGAGGYPIALHYLLKTMGESYARIDICHTQTECFANGVYGVSFQAGEPSFYSRLLEKNYEGVFLRWTEDLSMLPLLQPISLPIVATLYAVRGMSGERINQVFLWYSGFRDFDAFIVPSESVKSFYTQYLLDERCFHVSPLGVDHEVFRPTDKQLAKRQVAELVGDRRILEKPVVGFLSRLQPEKGGGTYLQIARMFPDALFLAVAPTLIFYKDMRLPDNFLQVGAQTREKLALFLNAFDVYCLPSVVGEESFGMSVLEAMACGTPPVASNFDGIPEVVGDAGVLVETETYASEMGSIAGYVSAEQMAEAIRPLLDNPEHCRLLGTKAHKHSLGFTWDKAAGDLVALFDELNRRRNHPMPQMPDTSVFFTPFLHESDGRLDSQSILAGVTASRRKLLQFDSYIQSVEEGLALALLKHHTWREVEAVLGEFCGHEEAKDVLKRVRQFLQTLSI